MQSPVKCISFIQRHLQHVTQWVMSKVYIRTWADRCNRKKNEPRYSYLSFYTRYQGAICRGKGEISPPHCCAASPYWSTHISASIQDTNEIPKAVYTHNSLVEEEEHNGTNVNTEQYRSKSLVKDGRHHRLHQSAQMGIYTYSLFYVLQVSLYEKYALGRWLHACRIVLDAKKQWIRLWKLCWVLDPSQKFD